MNCGSLDAAQRERVQRGDGWCVGGAGSWDAVLGCTNLVADFS